MDKSSLTFYWTDRSDATPEEEDYPEYTGVYIKVLILRTSVDSCERNSALRSLLEKD